MAKLLLILAVVAQFFFWNQTTKFRPNLGIVPPLPGEAEKQALSFGDKQLYFYINAFQFQMSGDTFGRSTPLKDYNYPLLNKWFYFLDTLDTRSNFVPSIAAYYFGKTQHPQDTIYIVDYLEDHAMKDPAKKWWWLSQAIYLANSVLQDKTRALRYAQQLRGIEADMPLWARQMEVFIHEQLGDKDKAEEIMCQTFDQAKHLAEAPKFEQDFMIHFFEERMNEALKGRTLQDVAELCARKYLNKAHPKT